MDKQCDVCRSSDAMVPLVEAGLVGVGPVWIHQCEICGFRQIRPRLEVSDLDALYGGDYFDTDAPHGFRNYARQKQRYERDAFFFAKELNALKPSGRLLEIGSALGFFLGAVSQQTRWLVEGVEVSAFGAWYARDRFNVTVHQGTLEEADLSSESFDYVLQKDLLEHVLQPRQHLEQTWRIMRPKARMRLITPNGEADIRPLERVSMSSTEVPVLGQGHLSFFSRSQLLRLLRETGFRVLHFRNIGLRRGIRALGFLPWSKQVIPCAPRESLVQAGKANKGSRLASVDDHQRRADRIDAAIIRSDSYLRRWRGYYYYRHLMKRFDALPAAVTIGQDFDVVIEKIDKS